MQEKSEKENQALAKLIQEAYAQSMSFQIKTDPHEKIRSVIQQTKKPKKKR